MHADGLSRQSHWVAGSPTTSSSISASSPPAASSALSVRVARPEDSRPDSAAWLRCRIVIPGRCPSAGAAGACISSRTTSPLSSLHSATPAVLGRLGEDNQAGQAAWACSCIGLCKEASKEEQSQNLCHATAFTHLVRAQGRQDTAILFTPPLCAGSEAPCMHNVWAEC